MVWKVATLKNAKVFSIFVCLRFDFKMLLYIGFTVMHVRVCKCALNLQDPNKETEAKIKADYDELYEEMAVAFRNLED